MTLTAIHFAESPPTLKCNREIIDQIPNGIDVGAWSNGHFCQPCHQSSHWSDNVTTLTTSPADVSAAPYLGDVLFSPEQPSGETDSSKISLAKTDSCSSPLPSDSVPFFPMNQYCLDSKASAWDQPIELPGREGRSLGQKQLPPHLTLEDGKITLKSLGAKIVFIGGPTGSGVLKDLPIYHCSGRTLIQKPYLKDFVREIARINPLTSRNHIQRALFQNLSLAEQRRLLVGADLIIAGMQDSQIHAKVNELSILFGIPALFVELNNNPAGVQLIWQIPEQTPCHRCVTLEHFAAKGIGSEGEKINIQGDLVNSINVEKAILRLARAILERNTDTQYARVYQVLFQNKFTKLILLANENQTLKDCFCGIEANNSGASTGHSGNEFQEHASIPGRCRGDRGLAALCSGDARQTGVAVVEGSG